MTDAQISEKLALAIGWNSTQITVKLAENGPTVFIQEDGLIRGFNYRRPSIIWAIAEKYDAFPSRQGKRWIAYSERTDNLRVCTAGTAAKAVALAVIWSLS